MKFNFCLNATELERLIAFFKEQKKKTGWYSIEESSCGIGTTTVLRNEAANTEVNITDYDSW
jgi:hypothetical protein